MNVSVEALGTGPSYQVEKDAVCKIVNNENPNEENLIFGGLPSEVHKSITLPDMGKSVNLRKSKGKGDEDETREQLYWQVYNHSPMIGRFSMDHIRGDELGASEWNESDIEKLFGGESQIDAGFKNGAKSKISGRVKGNVTLYGMPDTIVTGDLYVYAPALRVNTYIANGEQVKTYERTGGLKKTGIAIGAPPVGGGGTKRQGIGFEVPTLLVYMAERDSTKRPDMK